MAVDLTDGATVTTRLRARTKSVVAGVVYTPLTLKAADIRGEYCGRPRTYNALHCCLLVVCAANGLQ